MIQPRGINGGKYTDQNGNEIKSKKTCGKIKNMEDGQVMGRSDRQTDLKLWQDEDILCCQRTQDNKYKLTQQH
jgi:hypothetical protein